MSPKLSNWKSKGFYYSYKSLNIFYIIEGEGPCLLICHGYPYSSYDFAPVWMELTKHFTVIAADMPGMGFSDKPANHNYSFAEMANMYSALLSHLNVVDVDILSHDLGNSVVQELIARDLEKKNHFAINSIAFLNGGLFTDVYKPRLIQILLSKSPKPLGRLLSNLMTRRMVSKATAEVFGRYTKPSQELLDEFWEILNYKNGKSLAYLLGRMVFEKDIHQRRWITSMQQTTIPMCFINGPSDPNSGMHMAKRYKELLPDGIVFLLSKDIGHWPQIEAPEEVITSFFRFKNILFE